jgi:glycine/D-amino acid oxidase-like deaminating enzyme
MHDRCHAIIIGGGIIGCAGAFELAQRGLRVVVLEKGVVCGGATGRSSAIVRTHYSHETTIRMALYGLRVFEEFEDRTGGQSGFLRRGFLVLVPESDRPGLEDNVALQCRVGVRTEVLAADALPGVLPGVDTEGLVAAAWEEESGYADPHLTTQAYAAAARRHGATIMQGTEVTDILFDGTRVTGVRTPAGTLHAPIVVNCAGPWGARVASLAGVALPIRAARIQVAVFERPPAFAAPHPVVLDFVHASYFRPETGGLSLVGRIDPAEADETVDPDRYAEHADEGFVSDVGARWVRRLPAMEESRARGGYAGLYEVTPDWHPIIDEVPPGSGLFACTGFSGHGFKLAPAVGLMMAQLITGEPDPVFDASLFRFARFAEGKPVRGAYEYSIAG